MKLPRSSGILLHPTSLPSPYGIGDLGPQAFQFIDFLIAGGQRVWQVLPLGPTGFGDSPYQCFSAFAGNPLLISPELLIRENLLTEEETRQLPSYPADHVAYGLVIDSKIPLLRRAAERFFQKAPWHETESFQTFCLQQDYWLDDYALFMSLKEAMQGRIWTEWDPGLVARKPAALREQQRLLEIPIRTHQFLQYQFFKQWQALRSYAHDKNLRLIGDIPIFVAHDSADVWAHPDLFKLDSRGHPKVVAGVPPDYFSPTGQRWGNPIYRWKTMANGGYAWWVKRVTSALEMVDIIRLDHFRGFESYWEIPAAEETAVRGRWVKCPGNQLFRTLRKNIKELPIVAENLGLITPQVEALRTRYGFPGMAVLQFAFGSEDQDSNFLPHNYERNLVVYIGTHDNDTTVGWWHSQAGADSTRTEEEIQREHNFVKRYLATDGSEINWVFIRTILESVADLAIIPLQDLLGLGSEARMNVPARRDGNWRWRYLPGALTREISERLLKMTRVYGS